MSVSKTPGGTIIDRANPNVDKQTPPPSDDDGDMATPKSEPPTDDDQPLE